SRRGGQRPCVQGACRPDPSLPARPALPARRPLADRARVRAGDDALRRHEAPADPRGRGPRGDAAVGTGKAALPEPGPDPPDPRPVDPQVHGGPGLGARRAQGGTGGKLMTTMTQLQTVQVYRVYIKATPQAVWDAITRPEWNERYGYGGRGEYDL